MCGICGWFGSVIANPKRVAEAMSKLLRHRGPDDEGAEYGQGWAMAFRRLAILDRSALGHQPMRSPCGRYWLVFNGEIYNYAELRHDLEQQGERFISGSDTEVLLRLLMMRRELALPMLNGMFAFALVDTQARTFLLARDRLGVKPLYYYKDKTGLRFASELKALLAWPNASRECSEQAMTEYLAFGYISGDACALSGYSKLPPAHYLTGSLDRSDIVDLRPFWALPAFNQVGSRHISAKQLDELEYLLQDAVRIRLRSDVPIGVFVSGGIDSGIVGALSARAGVRRPMALTVGFEDESTDETMLAQTTVRHVGLEHRVVPQAAVRLNDIDRLAWFFDEPFGDPSALPTYTLCKAASAHATVFLSGDGGDEAFGGYRHYIETARWSMLLRAAGLAWKPLRKLAVALPQLSLMRYRIEKLAQPNLLSASMFDELLDDPAFLLIAHPRLQQHAPAIGVLVESRWNLTRGRPILERQQCLDYKSYLPDDILVKVDRASMAHSIEVRSPFLDYRVVEYASTLPRGVLINGTQGKMPLRLLGRRLLPPDVSTAKKKGFGAPVGEWLSTPIGVQMMHDRLLDARARDRGLWSRKGVARLIEAQQRDGGRDFGLLLWRLLMLEAWSRHYLDSRDPIECAPITHRAS